MSSFENTSEIKRCFQRKWPTYNLCRRMWTRLSQRNPRLRSGCAFKQGFRKLNAQSRTRVSRCYAASRTRQAILHADENFAVSIILFIFKTRHP